MANTYHIRTGGSDAASGLSDAEAWGSFAPLGNVRLQPGARAAAGRSGRATAHRTASVFRWGSA